MEESVIATFDNVKFIEGKTKLTGSNWREYFGSALKSGVYSGLDNRNSTDTHPAYLLNDGVLFANGLFAKIESENGYQNLGFVYNVDYFDRFVCARVNFDTESVEIIQKTGIASISGSETVQTLYAKSIQTMMEFGHDESYCCYRTNSMWEIPLFYQSKSTVGNSSSYQTPLRKGIDLTRRPFRKKNTRFKLNQSAGGAWYSFFKNPVSANDIQCVRDEVYKRSLDDSPVKATFGLDAINLVDGAEIIIQTIDGTRDFPHQICLQRIPYTPPTEVSDNRPFDQSYEIKYIFSDPSNWTLVDTEYQSSARQKETIRLTCVDCDYTEGVKCNYTVYVEDLL